MITATNSYVFQPGDVIRLDVYGTTLRCLINGNAILTASDADLPSGSPGISGSYATHSAKGDQWSAGDWTGVPLSVTTTLIPSATVNATYQSPALTANGGIAPVKWSILSGQLPPGLSLDTSTGVFSGLPTTIGNYPFTIQAIDSSPSPKTATSTFTLAVTNNDIYGGSTLITGSNTGNWHTEIINGRWWIIDPLGNAMHFTAPYNVGRGDGGMLNGSTMAARINSKYHTDNSNWPCTYLPAVVSRLKSWQFTGIGGGSDINTTPLRQNSCWGFDTTLGGYYMPKPYRMPTVLYFQTSGYAMQNVNLGTVSPLSQPVKNFNYGLNCYIGCRAPGGGEADYSDSLLYSYFDYLVQRGGSPYFSAPAELQSYIIGAFIDEADQVYSFTTGGRNPVFLTGYDHQHGGLRAFRVSPLQYANRTKSAIYPDGRVYVKAVATRSYLKSRYATIAALNAAWGSSYSACDMEGVGDEFGSCGTTVANEIFATADGSSSSYTHTLARSIPSLRSLAVYVGGALVAGDLAYNATDSDVYTAPGAPPTSPSKFYGPLIDTSSTNTNFINYTSATGSAGAVGIKFKIGSTALASISGNGSTVTVRTQSQHGSWPGAHVSVSGTINYNLTGLTIASVVDSYTFTILAPNSRSSEIGAGTVAFTDSSPPQGTLITITYVINGWGIGNGLMDEDGRHSNCLGANNDSDNGVQLNLCNGTGRFANAQIAADLDGVLGQMAADYFSNMNLVFGNHFGNGLNRKVLNLGPDPLIYWAAPPAPGVLRAAGQYTDILGIQSYMNGFSMTQAKLDYIRQYAGNKPLINVDFIVANSDSALRAYTANPAWVNYSTQENRGAAYRSVTDLLTSFAYTNGGIKPYIGTQFWQWADSIGEQSNFGLVSPYDNAYDGKESITSVVSCSAPIQSYSCGGEQYNSGDFVTGLKAANALWLLP